MYTGTHQIILLDKKIKLQVEMEQTSITYEVLKMAMVINALENNEHRQKVMQINFMVSQVLEKDEKQYLKNLVTGIAKQVCSKRSNPGNAIDWGNLNTQKNTMTAKEAKWSQWTNSTKKLVQFFWQICHVIEPREKKVIQEAFKKVRMPSQKQVEFFLQTAEIPLMDAKQCAERIRQSYTELAKEVQTKKKSTGAKRNTSKESTYVKGGKRTMRD